MATEKANNIRISNALSPLLRLNMIVVPSAFIFIAVSDKFNWISIIINCLLISVTVGAYFILLFRDPDRLQSENFQEFRHAMEYAEQKGDESPVSIEKLKPFRVLKAIEQEK